MDAPTLPVERGFVGTAAAAMTLHEDVFVARAMDAKPIVRGLVFVVAVGLIVALVGLVGAALTQWTSPDWAQLQKAVTEGVMGMPWTKTVPAETLDEVRRSMELAMSIAWGIVRALQPTLPSSLAFVLLRPLGMVVFWLVFGIAAHLCARLLSGTASLGQTLGATSLAAAPQLLGVVHVVPYVQAAGLGMWSLICAFLAVKYTHGLSPGRAFWATVLPIVLIALTAAVVGGAVGAALVASQVEAVR